MKVLKFFIVLLVVAAISVALYFFFINKQLEKRSLQPFLDENAVLYHCGNDKTIEKTTQYIQTAQPVFEFFETLQSNVFLAQIFQSGNMVVSWHLTRQNKIEPVIWLMVSENYSINKDSLPQGKDVGRLLEIKHNESSIFFSHNDGYVAVSAFGEIMEEIAESKFTISDSLRSMAPNNIKGNISLLKTYMEKHMPYLQHISLDGNAYNFSLFGTDSISLFHGEILSTPYSCLRLNSSNTISYIPESAQFIWVNTFSSTTCLMQLLNHNFGQLIWDLEAQYQFKVKSLLDAWIEGSVTWFYYNKEKQVGTVAALKLRTDAAPFAAANQFFTEFNTITIRVGDTTKDYKMARFIPGALSQIMIPEAITSENLFAVKYKGYLYMSESKTILTMVINELVNSHYVKNMEKSGSGVANFYFLFPNNNHQTTVQGRMIESKSGLYLQGSIANELLINE